jgi:hypothetical protein
VTSKTINNKGHQRHRPETKYASPGRLLQLELKLLWEFSRPECTRGAAAKSAGNTLRHVWSLQFAWQEMQPFNDGSCFSIALIFLQSIQRPVRPQNCRCLVLGVRPLMIIDRCSSQTRCWYQYCSCPQREVPTNEGGESRWQPTGGGVSEPAPTAQFVVHFVSEPVRRDETWTADVDSWQSRPLTFCWAPAGLPASLEGFRNGRTPTGHAVSAPGEPRPRGGRFSLAPLPDFLVRRAQQQQIGCASRSERAAASGVRRRTGTSTSCCN